MEALSASAIPKGEGWQYEPKWDGFRCLAFKDGDKVELHSKSAKLLTAAFPDIADALRALKPAAFCSGRRARYPCQRRAVIRPSSGAVLSRRLSATGCGALGGDVRL